MPGSRGDIPLFTAIVSHQVRDIGSGEMQAILTAGHSAVTAPPLLDVIDQRPTYSSTSLGWRHIEAHRFDGDSCRP